MHKKATFIVERITNELSSDEYLYPISSNGEYKGLSNTESVELNGTMHGGNTKFCSLFASRLNLMPGSEVRCAQNEKSATSIEGIDWYLPISDFKEGPETLIADVNSSDLPNCTYDENSCPRPDRFEYLIQPGERIPVKEVEYYEATGAPPAIETVEDTGKTPEQEPRPGKQAYTINCSASGATVYGAGGGKIDGNYMLVAVPNFNYKCNWFTKQVTVDGGNVTCDLQCTPGLDRPLADGEPEIPTPIPEPGDDDDDGEGYCINVEVTGEPSECTLSGDGCGKAPGLYVVTLTPNDPTKYTTSWEGNTTPHSKTVEIVDKDESISVDCRVQDEKKDCYSITVDGDIENCPVTLPNPNCPNEGETDKYMEGTYNVTVTPNEGYQYNNTTEPSTVQVKVSGKDATFKLGTCAAGGDTQDNTLTIAFSSSGGDFTKAQLFVTVDTTTPDGTTKTQPISPMIFPGGLSTSIPLTYPANTEYTLSDIKTYIWYNNSNEAAGTNGYGVADLDGKNQGLNSKITGVLDQDKLYHFTLHGDEAAELDTIKIDTTGASSSHKISGAGTNSITVYGRVLNPSGGTIIDALNVTGIKVVPSDTSKNWSVQIIDKDQWSVSPTSGKGTSGLTVTLDNNMTTGSVCMQAKYTDGSATSNKVCFKLVADEAPASRESTIRLTADVSSCCVNNATVNYTVKSDKGFNKTGTLTPTAESPSSTDITVPVGAKYTITGSVSKHTCRQNGCTFSWKEFSPSSINIPMLNASSSYTSKAVFGCSGCSAVPKDCPVNVYANSKLSGATVTQFNFGLDSSAVPITGDRKTDISVKPGAHTVDVKGGGMIKTNDNRSIRASNASVSPESFTCSNGETHNIYVTLLYDEQGAGEPTYTSSCKFVYRLFASGGGNSYGAQIIYSLSCNGKGKFDSGNTITASLPCASNLVSIDLGNKTGDQIGSTGRQQTALIEDCNLATCITSPNSCVTVRVNGKQSTWVDVEADNSGILN